MPQLKAPARAARDSFPDTAAHRAPTTAAAAPPPSNPRRATDALWQRLADHALDDPRDGRPLSVRLHQAAGWHAGYAQRVLHEYRRFMYLAVRRRGRVCPSGAVDLAWHTHLLDSARYFGEFCPRVLGATMHHVPSRGNTDTTDHRRRYRATLRAYRWVFGEAPPADIWPPCEDRFAERWRHVDQRAHWVLPRPSAVVRAAQDKVRRATQKCAPYLQASRPLLGGGARAWAAALVLPALLMLGCQQVRLEGPSPLNGPSFLSHYFWVLALLVIVGIWRSSRGTPATVHPVDASGLSAVDHAYLAGGPVRAVGTALAQLLQRGVLVLEPLNGAKPKPDTPAPWRASGTPDEVAIQLSPLERSAMQHIRAHPRLRGTPESLLAAQQAALDALHARLYGRGLLSSSERDKRQRGLLDLIYGAVWLVVLLWGAQRLFYGWLHGRPLTHLAVMLAVSLFLAALIHRRLPHRRTREGHAAVRQATRRLSKRRPLGLSDPLMPLGLALVGPSVLAEELAPLRDGLALLPVRDAGGGGCGGGGCGADGGCGGSDGGCGGGGD